MRGHISGGGKTPFCVGGDHKKTGLGNQAGKKACAGGFILAPIGVFHHGKGARGDVPYKDSPLKGRKGLYRKAARVFWAQLGGARISPPLLRRRAHSFMRREGVPPSPRGVSPMRGPPKCFVVARGRNFRCKRESGRVSAPN